MSNVIIDRVAYFLKSYPPFSFLQKDELEDIAHFITVRYCKKGETLFTEGQANVGSCFILRQGNIKLYQQNDEILVDQCEPGDVFGVRSILSGNTYIMSAICEEESLVYELEVAVFKKYLENNQHFALFFASGYAAGQAVVRGENQEEYLKKVSSIKEQPLQFSERVITCTPDTTIYQAAQYMESAGVGSVVVVNERKHPVGIMTDTDLRNKVVAGRMELDLPIKEVMSSPVRAIKKLALLSEVQIEMIRSKMHHLVITEDGTESSELLGIVSDHDIMVSMQNHPAALIKAIKYSDEVKKWAEIRTTAEELLYTYLQQEVSVSLLSNLITAINDTIIEKAIEIARQEIEGASQVNFAWLSLGSEGREEQLLRTDQDNAIIFEDVENEEEAQSILLKLAKRVNEVLMECGFEKCPANIMAGNPEYCQPLSSWKKYFKDWVATPDPKALMNSTIFYDFRSSYGSIGLAEELRDFIVKELSGQKVFMNHLAKNALQNPPPLSFFKNLVVERSGAHEDQFDIKKRAMMPLSDAARVLCLEKGELSIQNTVDRFKKLAQLEPKNGLLFEEAAQAYQIFMRVRALNGIKHKDSGRFIRVDQMNKLEKQILKNAFQPVKDVQDMMEVRFQLAYFS